jgi:hypothetical protein
MRPTPRRPTLAAFVLALVAIACVTRVQAETLEAIPLQYRLAEELLPILQPLLPPDAALTGAGDVLLVRADAATQQQVRDAVATLDRPPRQLLITVGQATTGTTTATSARGSATIGTGDVQVGVNRPPGPDAGARVTVQAGRDQVELRDISSVRALEGREVWIALTTSRPFTSTSTIHGGRHGVTQVHTVGRQDAQTGFLAIPHLRGDLVMLEISPSQQQLGTRGDAGIETRALTTTVSGRLGEWIELGGISTSGTDGTTGLITWGQRSELTQYSAWVKVEEVR